MTAKLEMLKSQVDWYKGRENLTFTQKENLRLLRKQYKLELNKYRKEVF